MLFSSWRKLNKFTSPDILYEVLDPLLFSHYLEVKCSLYGQMVLLYIKETISKTAYQHLYVSEIEIIPKLLRHHNYNNSFFWVENYDIKVFPNDSWRDWGFAFILGTGMFWGGSIVVVVEVVTSSDMRGDPPALITVLTPCLAPLSRQSSASPLTRTVWCWCLNTWQAPGQHVSSVSFSSTSTSLRQIPSLLMKISSGKENVYWEHCIGLL